VQSLSSLPRIYMVMSPGNGLLVLGQSPKKYGLMKFDAIAADAAAAKPFKKHFAEG
jgi:hypothetical protein